MRPTNVPQPLHHHKFREHNEDKLRAEASPGPARYSGAGVTIFDKNTLGGKFSKQVRFPAAQLVPGETFSSAERASYLEGSGPKYNPKFLDTRLATSFTTTSHLSKVREDNIPGPGAYSPDDPSSWDKGVTIPNSFRTSRSANNTPGPGAYTPTKQPLRTRSAFIGTTSALDTSLNKVVDRPPLASLESIERSMLLTRSQSPSIGFSKAPRKLVMGQPSDNPVGAGAYDIDSANTIIQKSVKGGKFSTSARMPIKKLDTDGRLVSLPRAELTSNHASSPSISFSKAAPQRGIPDKGKELSTVPTAKYSPIYHAVDANVKGIVGWGKPRAGKGRSVLQPSVTSNADFIDAKSTFSGPALSFAESTRPQNTSNGTPGPGAYSPSLKALKKEPRGAGMSKAPRELVTGIVGENTPGPIYDPDISKSRPPVAPQISIGHSNRQTQFAIKSDGPDATYTPKYSQIDRNQRSAIVYLTE